MRLHHLFVCGGLVPCRAVKCERKNAFFSFNFSFLALPAEKSHKPL